MAELNSFVHVFDENGVAHAFGPGDTVPSWAVSKITNPKAWIGSPAPELASVEIQLLPGKALPIPAKGGPKATADAWTAYAVSAGLPVPQGTSRKEIMAALVAAGIPTE